MPTARHTLDHPVLDKVLLSAWLVVCGLLPINGGWVPIPLLTTIVLGLVLAMHRKPVLKWSLLWPLFAFYAMHIIGMAWTTDISFGLFDLQIKLGLVFLPVVAAVLITQRKDLLRLSMITFTLGTVVAILFGLHKAWTCYGGTGQANCFSQSTLSYSLHPSYAAWYGCWCVAYWGHQLLAGKVTDKRLRTAVLINVPLVLLFTVMLASKSGVVGLAVVLALLLLAAFIKLRGKARITVALLVVGMVVIAFAAQGPLLWARMQASRTAVELARLGDPSIYASAEGSALRTVAWICSVERLRVEPMGAGTGDIKHALMDCYLSKGAMEAASRKLNSHGQFFQAGVALGWIGLMLLVVTLLLPVLHAIRAKHVLLLQFTLLVVVNAAVESILEVQAGVVFFGLFFGMLVAEVRTSVPDKTGT